MTFQGNTEMHPVRGRLLDLARERPDMLEIRHVPPTGTSAPPAEWLPFERLADWEILIDVPGGGWSGRQERGTSNPSLGCTFPNIAGTTTFLVTAFLNHTLPNRPS